MLAQTFWLPEQASTTAPEVDALFYFIYWTSAIMLGLVTWGIGYYAWKYRRRSHADRPEQVKENKALELSWIIIPTLLVAVVFFWGFRVFVNTSVPPPNAYEVNVQAQSWKWTFYYDEGPVTDTLFVPANTPVHLTMYSTDVLHSFFVPAFRVKHDVLPNRYTSVWFEAVEPGEYTILCTEYCGTAHSNMGAVVMALPRQEFYDRLATGFSAGVPCDLTPAEYGEQLYTAKTCNTCHSLDGSAGNGPSWLGTWGQPRPGTAGSPVMDYDYTLESIWYPNRHVVEGYGPVMPSYDGQLDSTQVYALTQFMQQINDAGPSDTYPAPFAPECRTGEEPPAETAGAEAAEEGGLTNEAPPNDVSEPALEEAIENEE